MRTMMAITLLFFSTGIVSAQQKQVVQVSPNVQVVLGKIVMTEDVPAPPDSVSELLTLFSDLTPEIKKQLEAKDTEIKCVVTIGLLIKPKVRLVNYTIDKKDGPYSQYTGRYVAKAAEGYSDNLKQLAEGIALKVN